MSEPSDRRLIGQKIVREITNLSAREQRRREEEDEQRRREEEDNDVPYVPFPKHVKLGRGRNGRIAYVEDEIRAWVGAQIARRDRELALDETPIAAIEPPPALPSDGVPIKRGRGRPKGSKNKPGHRAGRRSASEEPQPRPLAAASFSSD